MAKSTNTTKPQTAERFDAFSVREFQVEGETKTEWLKVGSAFPHKDGKGFNVILQAMPINGQISVRLHEPKAD